MPSASAASLLNMLILHVVKQAGGRLSSRESRAWGGAS
jgi:hypothetical protein